MLYSADPIALVPGPMNFVCTTCKREVETPGHFCPFCGTPAPTPTPKTEDPLVGRKIGGKYFVHQRLGKGGMGLVYKATDVVLDRPLALKMLDRALLSDAGMVQRFHREARAASRLNHPNCITILDFGQLEDGQLFIAMEFLPGRPLTKLVAEEFPLSHARVIRIGAQILAALAEAHAAGVIHRDLKLSNVMVEARRDEPDFVKVLDFGIAKLVAGDNRSELTTAGMICGTPGYMSPEQARGEELDARSDLYSVGIILYELLTGRLPFESETPMALAVKHITEMAVAPSARRPELGIPPELDALVMRALAKSRDERFASAEEMRAALLDVDLGEAGPHAGQRQGVPATMVIPSTPRPQQPRRPSGANQPATRPTPRASDSAPGSSSGRRTPAAVAAAPAPAPRRMRPALLAGIAAGAPVLVAIVATLIADPFSSTGKPPPADEPELVLPPRPTSAQQPPPAGASTTSADSPAPGATAANPQPAPPPAGSPPSPPPPDPEPKAVLAEPQPQPAPEPTPPPPKLPRAQKGIQQVADALGVLRLPPAASGAGLLVVNASPWGQAVVDGKEVGETPKELRVGAGRYRVKVVHPTLGAREGQVVVEPGKRRVFLADFAK
ncbi:MAG TPA: protein kinase [Anaeromyxobacter sp.]|nr:protein kinase [Anaeromyxobacter sp.]